MLLVTGLLVATFSFAEGGPKKTQTENKKAVPDDPQVPINNAVPLVFIDANGVQSYNAAFIISKINATLVTAGETFRVNDIELKEIDGTWGFAANGYRDTTVIDPDTTYTVRIYGKIMLPLTKYDSHLDYDPGAMAWWPWRCEQLNCCYQCESTWVTCSCRIPNQSPNGLEDLRWCNLHGSDGCFWTRMNFQPFWLELRQNLANSQ